MWETLQLLVVWRGSFKEIEGKYFIINYAVVLTSEMNCFMSDLN